MAAEATGGLAEPQTSYANTWERSTPIEDFELCEVRFRDCQNRIDVLAVDSGARMHRISKLILERLAELTNVVLNKSRWTGLSISRLIAFRRGQIYEQAILFRMFFSVSECFTDPLQIGNLNWENMLF